MGLTDPRSLSRLVLASQILPHMTFLFTQDYWVNGVVSPDLAGDMLSLLRDMVSGSLGEEWKDCAGLVEHLSLAEITILLFRVASKASSSDRARFLSRFICL